MEVASVAEVALGDLLDDETLGLNLLVGGPDTRTRIVEGAHSIELLQPGRWLDRGWVMLTTGLALAESAAAQRDLVRELDECGVVALGFGVGVSFDEVPYALVDEALRREFPLFTVPLATPFREVIAAVRSRTADSEAYVFNRVTAMQRHLLSALAEPDPESCIVGRLSEFVQSDVALVDRTGRVVHGHVPVERGDLRAATDTADRHPQRFEEEDFRGWVFPVGGTEGQDRCRAHRRWLVTGVTAPSREHPLLKAAARLALPLLEASARLAESLAQQERAIRRATFDLLLDVRSDADGSLAAARAGAFQVDVSDGVRVGVVMTRMTLGFGVDELLEAVDNRVASFGWRWLTTVRDDAVAVLVPADVTNQEMIEVLLGAHPQALVGIGRTVRRPDAVSASRLDAALVVRQRSQRSPRRAAAYEDLDVASALIGEIDPERIRSKVDQWLQPVIENPMAYDTLVAYIENDLDVGRTSRALKVHPNSTRYRLNRIEDLLGEPLRRPSTIAALHFALLSHHYTAETRTGSTLESARAA